MALLSIILLCNFNYYRLFLTYNFVLYFHNYLLFPFLYPVQCSSVVFLTELGDSQAQDKGRQVKRLHETQTVQFLWFNNQKNNYGPY